VISAAIVEVMRQVPKVSAVRVAVAEVESDSEQPVAVPFATEKVFAPLPLALVVIERACEYGYDFEEVPSDVIEIV